MEKESLVTGRAIMVFPALMRSKKDDKGKEYWGATLLFNKSEEIKDIVAAAQKVAMEKFGKFDASIKKPFKMEKRPDKIEKFPFLENKIVVNTKSNFAPSLLSLKEGVKKPILDSKELYSGCIVHASIQLFPWEHKTNGRGVSAQLLAILKVEDGERLGHVPGSEFDHLIASESYSTTVQDSGGLDGMFD